MILRQKNAAGILAALGSAFFLGVSPVLGRAAITLGMDPIAVVAFRTGAASLLLLLIVLLFNRHLLYIYPLGLLGCFIAGLINGSGSLLYYLALGRLPASLGQMLYSLYPFFVALWMMLDHQFPSRLTMLRLTLAAVAVLLLAYVPGARVDALGVWMMLGAAVLYALHLPINQRVLYEAPAPTVTLYTLISMSAVVIPAYVLLGVAPSGFAVPWGPLLGLTLATFLSRLALFLGVKSIGGMQTAILGLAELLVTILLGTLWLHERLTPLQWTGAVVLALSLLLVRFEPAGDGRHLSRGWLAWIRPPEMPRDIWPPYQ